MGLGGGQKVYVEKNYVLFPSLKAEPELQEPSLSAKMN